MALDFPTSLPCPQTELVTPFDRAQRSDERRPRDARALSLDRLAVVRDDTALAAGGSPPA